MLLISKNKHSCSNIGCLLSVVVNDGLELLTADGGATTSSAERIADCVCDQRD